MEEIVFYGEVLLRKGHVRQHVPKFWADIST